MFAHIADFKKMTWFWSRPRLCVITIKNCLVRYLQLLFCKGSILSVPVLLGIDFIPFLNGTVDEFHGDMTGRYVPKRFVW
jgi:hypothetical protein